MEVDVEPASAESVRPVAADEIVAVWPDVSKLAATLAVHEPTTLRCRMSRPRPIRTGRTAMQVRVSGTRLECIWTADFETLSTPAYQHQVRIDPRLRIVDASVTEDAAERLLRWSRAGDVVTLFLSDKTGSRQTIRLQAVMPVQPPQEVPLPRVELLNANLAAAELFVKHASEVAVEFAQPRSLPRVDSAGDAAESDEGERVLGQFQLEGLSDTVLLRVRAVEPPSTGSGGAATAAAAQRGLDRVAAATQRRLGGDWTVADVRTIAASVCAWIVVLLFAIWFRRFHVRRWLNEHETSGLLLLGLAWWVWLLPSWLGLVVVAMALFRKSIGRGGGAAAIVDVPEGQFPITV
jgi:hypothetical protein